MKAAAVLSGNNGGATPTGWAITTPVAKATHSTAKTPTASATKAKATVTTTATTTTNTGSSEGLGDDDSSDGDSGDTDDPPHSRPQIASWNSSKPPIRVHQSIIRRLDQKDQDTLSKLVKIGRAVIISELSGKPTGAHEHGIYTCSH